MILVLQIALGVALGLVSGSLIIKWIESLPSAVSGTPVRSIGLYFRSAWELSGALAVFAGVILGSSWLGKQMSRAWNISEWRLGVAVLGTILLFEYAGTILQKTGRAVRQILSMAGRKRKPSATH